MRRLADAVFCAVHLGMETSSSVTVNPSADPQTIAYPADGARPHRRDIDALAPHVIVLFGATGDLAKRKLLPGMAYLVQSSLAPKIRVVGTSLEDLTDDQFRQLTKEAVDAFGTHKLTKEQWDHFASRITYVPQGAGPEALAAAVTAAETELGADASDAAGAAPEVRRTIFRYRRRPRGPSSRC